MLQAALSTSPTTKVRDAGTSRSPRPRLVHCCVEKCVPPQCRAVQCHLYPTPLRAFSPRIGDAFDLTGGEQDGHHQPQGPRRPLVRCWPRSQDYVRSALHARSASAEVELVSLALRVLAQVRSIHFPMGLKSDAIPMDMLHGNTPPPPSISPCSGELERRRGAQARHLRHRGQPLRRHASCALRQGKRTPPRPRPALSLSSF